MKKKSCTWPGTDKLMQDYHDGEWGVPLHDDKKLFEFMVLDAFQAGLSWAIVLKKREAFRKAAVQKEFGSFDKYIWQFTNYKPIVNKWQIMGTIPAKTEVSDEMSKDLKKRGFSFVGSTICYSFMQAAGMINDHIVECFRYKEVQKIN
ncbi:MAG: DNA-3-methyladenine glycosylase I [Ignavibacteriae bacterium]|nr:DNA-3-methyladenine glycosylase I [Ignavibacteriota bacterium]